MQSVTEISLPVLAIETPDFAANPAPEFKRARAQHPWLAKVTYGYIVTEYNAMRELISQDDSMGMPHEGIIELMKAKGSKWETFQMESILAMKGEHHKRIRDIVAAAFTPRIANMHRGLMRDTIAQLLEEWVPKGKFDFEEFASFFPITVMCNLVGAPPAIVPKLKTSLETLGLSFNLIPDFVPQLDAACAVMEELIGELLAARKNKPANAVPNLLDALLEAQTSRGLTDAELNSLLIFLFVAGYDTSKNVLTMIMHQLLTRPEMYERCADDFAYCQKVVEENLRFQNPGTSTRVTSQDVTYRDVVIPKDTMLFFPNSMIGRDPGMFPEPDKIDPERANSQRHIAFGAGPHMCLGQHIARAQIQEGFHQIAQRIKNPKLVGTVGYRPFPGTWGMKGLPIEFTPAPARATVTH